MSQITHIRPETDGGAEEKSGVGAVAPVQSGEKVASSVPLLGNRISDHSFIPKHQMPFRTTKRPPVHPQTRPSTHRQRKSSLDPKRAVTARYPDIRPHTDRAGYIYTISRFRPSSTHESVRKLLTGRGARIIDRPRLFPSFLSSKRAVGFQSRCRNPGAIYTYSTTTIRSIVSRTLKRGLE